MGAEPAVVGLIGVIVGAVLTFGFNLINERAKWLRSKDARLSDARRETYAKFSEAAKLETIYARGLAAGLGIYVGANPLGKEGLTALRDSSTARSSAFEALLLVGDPATVKSARLWQADLLAMRQASRGELPDADFATLYEAAGRSRDRFYESARRSLGVDGAVDVFGGQ